MYISLILLLLGIFVDRNKCLISPNISISSKQKFVQEANFSDPKNGTGFLLDSKIQDGKAIFLSSTLIEYQYYSKDEQDKILHVLVLDCSKPYPIIFNDYLRLSTYISFSNIWNLFYFGKILSVDPLILYINYGQMI